jgi:flagellar FliL protein
MATSAPKAVPKIVPAAPEAVEAPPKSKKKLFLILGLLLVLAAGAGAAWYFLVHAKAPSGKDAQASKVEAPPVFLVLEAFTVNLQTEGADQFLQTSLTLQVADQAQVDVLKMYMPEVRNRLLLLLSGKLAEEIAAALKKPFTPGGKPQQISNVLFTSFVIQ